MNIQNVWNTIVERDREPITASDYIRSSDIGKTYIDRYYKMLGTPYTNDFDTRTLRVFKAGKLFEDFILDALDKEGVIKERQKEIVIPETAEHLKVVGHIDALLEGNKVLELKTVNSRAFWAHKNRDENGRFLGYDHHKLQLASYMIGLNTQYGSLLYISKDDLCVEEVPVFRIKSLEERLFEDLRLMSNFYRNGVIPKAPDEIIYNPLKDCFETNWEVGRSNYLTKIYNYKDKDDFRIRTHRKLLDINRALRHYRADKLKDEDLKYKNEYNFLKLHAQSKVPIK